jgi:hypothetical protein
MTEVHPQNHVPYGDQHKGRLGHMSAYADGRFEGRINRSVKTHAAAPNAPATDTPIQVIRAQNRMQTEPKSSYHAEQFGENRIARRKSRFSDAKSR